MSMKKLCLLNFEDETNLLLPVDQIDIGFAAKSAINKSKASRQTKEKFYNEYQEFLGT